MQMHRIQAQSRTRAMQTPAHLSCSSTVSRPSLVVGVRSTFRSALDDVHEAAVEDETLLGTARQALLLLRLGNLRRLILHLSGARQASVDLPHDASLCFSVP